MDGGKLKDLNPTKRNMTLRNAVRGRNALSKGITCQLVIQYQMFSPENTHKCYFIILNNFMYMHKHTQMNTHTFMHKEARNWKENQEGYVGKFEGKERKVVMMFFILISKREIQEITFIKRGVKVCHMESYISFPEKGGNLSQLCVQNFFRRMRP